MILDGNPAALQCNDEKVETVKIAFIGLGVMGFPMAKLLEAAGHQVVGYSRSRSSRDRFVEVGGAAAESVTAAVAGAEAVYTMLPDSPDVIEVYEGNGGVFESAPSAAVLIDSSTIRPDVAVELSRAAERRGFDIIDAPVSGGQKGAEEGTLSVMCGGSEGAFERARPLLEIIGSTIIRVGEAGAGQTVKAANQLLVAGTIELVAEALVFLDAHGVDLAPAVKVLSGGLAGNAILTRKAEAMLAGQFTPGFRAELHRKDLGIYREAARDHKVFSPLGALLGELIGSLCATGGGNLDHSALLAQVSELSGQPRWARS
jgi:2-hydroxy-3-oxopropionate reductase